MNEKYIYSEKNLQRHANTKYVSETNRDTINEKFFYINNKGEFTIDRVNYYNNYFTFRDATNLNKIGFFKNALTGVSFREDCESTYRKHDYSSKDEDRTKRIKNSPNTAFIDRVYNKIIQSVYNQKNFNGYSKVDWAYKYTTKDPAGLTKEDTKNYLDEGVRRGDLKRVYENKGYGMEYHYYYIYK